MKLKFFLVFIVFFMTASSMTFAAPSRIISLKPNITEILFALGAGDRVVGVTKYCDYPQEVKKLPKVADYTRPFVEPVIALKPDLVIGSKEESSRRSIIELQNIGIRVELFSFTTLQETIESIRLIGELVGKKERGDEIVGNMSEYIATLKKRWENSPRPKVLAAVGRRPLIVAGPKTYIGDILKIIGAQNVVTATSMPYPRWSFENIIGANPEVIIDMSMETARAEEVSDAMKYWQELQTVSAVRDGRLYAVDIGSLRQSPRIIEGIEKLGKMIH
jgi:iron complex transport system substrate-binding protein